MTREEAIEVLKKNRPGADPRRCGLELCTAVDMAIAALREQDVTDTNVGNKWISVQDALPVINDNEPLEEFATDRGYTFIVSDGKYVWTELFLLKANKFDDETVTHWRPIPTVPPEVEVWEK